MYEEYIKKLKAICIKKKLKVRRIGFTGKNKEYPMYKIIIDRKNPKKTVCFSAGIHGDEIAGPLTIIKFIETFDKRKYKNIKIIIFPVSNPSGFEHNKRKNFLNIDLNRHFFDENLIMEDKILYNSIKNENLFFFHSLHENCEETRFYLYNFETKKEKVYSDILKLAKKYFSLNTAKQISQYKADNGRIINIQDGSFEDKLYHEGAPYSMCTETPGKKPLEERINLGVEIMNFVLEFSHN